MHHLTANNCPFRSFVERGSKPLVGKLRDAEMGLTRVGFGHHGDGLHVEVDRQDAYYVIYQLRDHPPHEYWVDGRAAPAPMSPRGSIHIADLNAAPSARLVEPVDSINIVLPRAFLNELSEDVGAAPVRSLAVPEPWSTQDAVLSRLEPVLVAALTEPQSFSSLFVDHLATATALHIVESYGSLRRQVTSPGALAPWQERRARELIAANLTKDISMAEVAAECRLSVSHFSRAFKISVGLTPHGWLQANRVDRAKEMLQRSAFSLAEIAVQCGFADQSHFSRTFKSATGVTPGAWRRLRLS